MKKICVVGNIANETKIFINCFPNKNEQIYINKLNTCIGGAAACTASALKRLGFEVTIFSYIGIDKSSKNIFKILKKIGIDTKYLIANRKSTLSFYTIFDNSFNRIMYINNQFLHKDGIEMNKLNEAIFNADVLVLCPIEKRIFDKSIQIAKKFNKIIISAPQAAFYDYEEEYIYSIFNNSNLMFLSKDEAYNYFGINNLDELSKYIDNIDKFLIITKAEKGSKIIAFDSIIDQSPFPCKVLDPSSAGDCFLAGFLWGFLNGHTLETSAKAGSIMGSLACQSLNFIEEGFSFKKFISKLQVKNTEK